ISALAAAHGIEIPAAVELRPTFPHSQNRTIAEQKSYRAALLVDSQFLQRLAGVVRNFDCQRIMFDRDTRACHTLAGCGRPRWASRTAPSSVCAPGAEPVSAM